MQIPEHVLLAVMPYYSFPKNQPEWHVINQRLQRAGGSVRPLKISVRPRPETAMPVSTVVPLHAVPQRITLRTLAVENNLPREKRIRMRRTRKPDPPLIA